MPLPANFQFSQHNLQDFLECPRRFQLRYVLKHGWPALQSEPVQERERHALLGVRFHQMIHQQHLGMDTTLLTASNADADLHIWWQRYLENAPQNLPARQLTEFTLTAPFAGYRLIAKYDLLAIEPGQKLVIIDWKTGQRLPTRQLLSQRMQTRLYPLLAVLAGHSLQDNQPVEPEMIEMIYWFTSKPESPVIFQYTDRQFQADRQELTEIIEKIHALRDDEFPLTNHEEICAFCNYRSLCNRGARAGDWTNSEDESTVADDSLLDLDLGQIGEVQF